MTPADPADALPATPVGDGRLEIDALKALAHPLRIRLLDTLSTYGPATASGLADTLDESSGATSYHLRQLAKYDLVREIEGRGTARERWWERVPRPISLWVADERTPSSVAASKLVINEWAKSRERLLMEYIEGADELEPEWRELGTISLATIWTTPEQLRHLTERFEAFMNEQIEPYRNQRVPGARPTQLHINLFPVIDGAVIAQGDES